MMRHIIADKESNLKYSEGLTADKPVKGENGEHFYDVETQIEYWYDAENSRWIDITTPTTNA